MSAEAIFVNCIGFNVYGINGVFVGHYQYGCASGRQILLFGAGGEDGNEKNGDYFHDMQFFKKTRWVETLPGAI